VCIYDGDSALRASVSTAPDIHHVYIPSDCTISATPDGISRNLVSTCLMKTNWLIIILINIVHSTRP